MTRVLTLSGSLRRGSANTAVLEAARRLAPPGVEVMPYGGMGGLPHFNPDVEAAGLPPPVAGLRADVGQADALLISSPEYAHGIPGSLKNLLDWLVGSTAFAGKPVALLNASPRAEHAQRQLAEVLGTMAARLVPAVAVPLPGPAPDAAGIAGDAQAAAAIRGALAALLRAAEGAEAAA